MRKRQRGWIDLEKEETWAVWWEVVQRKILDRKLLVLRFLTKMRWRRVGTREEM